jgi:hypothetical protein
MILDRLGGGISWRELDFFVLACVLSAMMRP